MIRQRQLQVLRMLVVATTTVLLLSSASASSSSNWHTAKPLVIPKLHPHRVNRKVNTQLQKVHKNNENQHQRKPWSPPFLATHKTTLTSLAQPQCQQHTLAATTTTRNRRPRRTSTASSASEADRRMDYAIQRDLIRRQAVQQVLREQQALRAGNTGERVNGASFLSSNPNEFTSTNAGLELLQGLVKGTAQMLKLVLPPAIQLITSILRFYRALPRQAIVAQAGLVYCLAGGYYPTLFSSLVAAQHCGWETAVEAIQIMTDEALLVVDLLSQKDFELVAPRDGGGHLNLVWAQTQLVLKTVDPVRLNQAAGALYTTWLGVSAVLEKEYARVISLSLTLASALNHLARWILEPPLRWVVDDDYHKWVPVVLGWGCKGLAMNVAWRMQRVLTAFSSALAGGVMFVRACRRMIMGGDSRNSKQKRRRRRRRQPRRWPWQGKVEYPDQQDLDDEDEDLMMDESDDGIFFSTLDETLGLLVAGIGFWTQIQVQYKNNFSFAVPFPLNLITWPFDLLEKWIQWQITK